MKVYEQSSVATKSKEEFVLPQEILGEKSIRRSSDEEERIDLRSNLITLRDEVISIHRDKRKWTTVLLLSTVWIIVFMLGSREPISIQLRVVEYITGGGVGDGVLQLIGSMGLKVVYSYFMVSTVVPILLGEYKFEGWRLALAKIRSIDYRKESNLIMILLGISLSMYIYNFLAGRAFLQNTMIGFVMLVMLFKSYTLSDSTIKLAVSKLTLKAKRSKNMSSVLSDRFLLGMIIGSALAIALSGLNIAYSCYFVGTLILLGVFMYLGLEHKR